jgi:hypothetical protein
MQAESRNGFREIEVCLVSLTTMRHEVLCIHSFYTARGSSKTFKAMPTGVFSFSDSALKLMQRNLKDFRSLQHG